MQILYPISCAGCDFTNPSPNLKLSFHIAQHSVKVASRNLLTFCLDQSHAQPSSAQDTPQLLLQGFGGDDHVSPTQVLDDAAVENEDDDYWDVDSDEEMADIENEQDEGALLSSKDFNALRRIHFENSNELEIRRYDAFLYDGILSHYRPEFAASPLRNPKTLRVFAHYIHVVCTTWSKNEHMHPHC